MPIKYEILTDKKLVYAVAEGRVTIDELLDHIRELAADPRYEPPMKKLVDYRNAPVVALSVAESDHFTEAKKAVAHRFTGEVCAIVVKHDIDFGMSRLHGAKAESARIDTNVFRRFEEALSWLDVELNQGELKPGIAS